MHISRFGVIPKGSQPAWKMASYCRWHCVSNWGADCEEEGIEVDTLPQTKLERLKEAIFTGWQARKACAKRELQSPVGQLQHACRVIRSGRTFLRTMINPVSVAGGRHRHQ